MYYTLQEFKKWWPDFEEGQSFYFAPANCPVVADNRFGRFRVVGRWGMFAACYKDGRGRMLVGEIVKKDRKS